MRALTTLRGRLYLVLLVGLLGCLMGSTYKQGHAAEPTEPEKDFSGQPAHRVLRVIDGDTAVLSLAGKETTVRLVGVDAPEPAEAYGQEASRFTTNLLKGESVYVEYEPPSKQDRFGRTLAYLYRAPDGLFVNLEVVRQGYAHIYTARPFRHRELFLSYETRAQQAGKGLWGLTVAPAAKPAERPEGVTVYVTRTGQKYHRGGCRYLSKSQIPISLKDAKARGYGPCSVCAPPR